jgi:hypothetical protein
MIIAYTPSKEDIKNALDIWNQYINIRGDRHSELILIILTIPMVWVLVEETTYQYFLTLFLVSMALFLYFRNYYYKLNKNIRRFLIDTDKQIIKTEDNIYKIRKMILEDKYLFVFYKKYILVLNVENLPSKERDEILSIFGP